MAKREKIILIIMAAVVLFGIYNFLPKSKTGKKPLTSAASVADAKKFAADVTNSLKNDGTGTDLYIIRQAKAGWTKDPFQQIKPKQEARKEGAAKVGGETRPAENRVYTGYLRIGERLLAIIDGAEYGIGEELGRGGPIVKSIDAKQVVITDQNTREKTILPLRETQ